MRLRPYRLGHPGFMAKKVGRRDNILGMKQRTNSPRKLTKITFKRAALWVRENQEAIRSSNDYVERFGLPLAKYRML